MSKNLLYKFFLIGYGIIHLLFCQAQSSFKYKSVLNDITSAGFYKIVLPPAIVSKCRNELNDIRILNGKGVQAPYILKSDQPQFQENNFIELPILTIKKEADKQTHIVIQNKLHQEISELLLIIKNNDAERTVTISGSDDQKKWFVIKERIALNNLFLQQRDRFIQSLAFPNSSYKFFEIIINGKDLLPINIVKVGMYQGVFRNGAFLNIPAPAIYQIDSSNKSSYISVTFNGNYLINKLELNIQGPKFFRRSLIIQKNEGSSTYEINEFVLSSAIDPSYTINARTGKITLIIENQDSPPLKILSVKAYQISKYLLTYLDPANKYELVFGDSTANAPRYDLEFFKDSINNAPLEISLGPIMNAGNEKPGNKQEAKNNTLILWIIIGVVLVFLLALTFRMIKEISNKDREV